MIDEYLLPQMMSRSTPEDILTEALAYVLRNSGSFRRRLTKRVWGDGVPDDDDFEIGTQRAAGGGRADLLWKAPRRTFILEAKIWAFWGEGQPNRYVRELRDEGGDVVFGLVAPSNRVAALRKEAVQRLRKDFHLASWNEGVGKAEEVRLVCFSWHEMGDWVRTAAKEEDDARAKMHMEEIFVVTDDIDPRFESKPDCLAVDGLGAAFRDLCRIVVNVRTRLESDGVDVGRVSSGDDKGLYYGFYLKPLSSSVQVWFGVWIGPWASERVGPLWLISHDREAVRWLRSRVRGAVDYGGSCVVPVRLEGSTWDEVRERAVARLNGIISAVQEGK